MMNPLRLCLLTLGSGCFLAIGPYAIKQVVHPPAVLANEPSNKPVTTVQPLRNQPDPVLTNRTKTEPPKQTLPPPQPVAVKTEPAAVTAPQNPVVPEPKSSVVVASLPAPAMALPERTEPERAPQPHPPAATPKPELPFRADVKKAQEHLLKLGFEFGTADGKLGPKTQAALAEFQKRQSIRVSSDADAETIKVLEKAVAELPSPEPKKSEVVDTDQSQFIILKSPKSNLKPGPVPTLNKVADVKRIQEALVAAGFYTDAPDGKWGRKTIDAVTAFQKKGKLKTTGKPNSETWNKLFAAAQAASAEKPQKNTQPVTAKTVVVADAHPDRDLPVASAAGKDPAAWPRPLISGNTSTGQLSAISSGIEAQVKAALIAEPTVVADRVAPEAKPPTGKSEPASAPVKADEAPAPAQPANANVLEISKPATEAATALNTDNAQVEKAMEKPLAVAADSNIIIRLNADAGNGQENVLEPPAQISSAMKGAVETGTPTAAADDPIQVPQHKVTAKPGKRDQAAEEQLERDLTQAQAGATSRHNDTNLVVQKDLKVVESVDNLVNKVERDLQKETASAGPGKTGSAPAAEMDKAKTETLKKKAELKVGEVDEMYKMVKERFAEQVKKGDLADRMAKIDTGYKAMKDDFKKGNYSPIVDRCDGFRLAIEMLADDAARNYLASKMDKTVRAKLKKATVDEIDGLRDQKKYLEAIEVLDAGLKVKGTPDKTKRRG